MNDPQFKFKTITHGKTIPHFGGSKDHVTQHGMIPGCWMYVPVSGRWLGHAYTSYTLACTPPVKLSWQQHPPKAGRSSEV